MAGRPSKYSGETTAKICDAIRAGNTQRASCAYAGISQDTFANWLRDFSDFSDAIKKAEADCEVANVATIKKAATGYDVHKTVTKTSNVGGVVETVTTETTTREFSWQAAAWWLERRRAEDYKLRTSNEHTGAGGGPIMIGQFEKDMERVYGSDPDSAG